MNRTAKTGRTTKETDITASVNLDGGGNVDVDTGIKFLDHMIASLGRHSLLDIEMRARSVDGIAHHLVEDAGIVLGKAISDALGERVGIVRFGHASVPLDESLASSTVDLIRRPYRRIVMELERHSIEDVSREDLEHFFHSLIGNMECCIHIEVRGENDHHKAEAAIKSLAVALRAACAPDLRRSSVPSTKGSMA